MRIFLVFFLALSLIFPAVVTQAADYMATPKAKTEKKVMKQKNYTAQDLGEDTPSPEEAVGFGATETAKQTPTECTKADRDKLEEYDKILASYYEESKFVAQNQDKFETTKDIENIQKNMDVYTDFIGSEDYKESLKLRQLCNMPAPPRPYDWPTWMPVPDPLDAQISEPAAESQPEPAPQQ